MPPKVRLGALAAMLALFSASIPAQDADTTADVRCVVVALKVSAMPAAAQQSAGMMLALYYIGRLDGRVPRLDLEDLIVKQFLTMTAADVRSEAQRCGASLTEKGRQITTIGNDLVKRGQKMQDEAAAPPRS